MQEYIPYIRTDLDVVFGNVDKYPVVGIIMPLYNHGKYLHQSLKSIIEQDYPNKLVIIVDDKSTDNSLEVAKSLINIRQELKDKSGNDIWVGNIIPDQIFDGVINDDVQVVLIGLQTNSKQWYARNIGISTCWNYIDFVNQLDADDWFLPNKLSKSVDVIKKDIDNIGLVYTDTIIVNEITGVTTHEFREPYSWDRLLNECIVSNTPLINKKIFEDVGLYEDLSPCEDFWQWIKIARKYICIHLPEPLSVYRVTPQSCTFVCNKSLWEDRWKTIHQRIVNEQF